LKNIPALCPKIPDRGFPYDVEKKSSCGDIKYKDLMFWPYWSGKKLNHSNEDNNINLHDKNADSTTNRVLKAVDFPGNPKNTLFPSIPPEINERIYRFVLSMPVVLFELDVNDKVVFINDSIDSVMGYSSSYLADRDFWDVIFPDRYLQYTKIFKQKLETDGIVEGELFTVNAEGFPMTVFMCLSRPYDKDGETTGTVGFLMNAEYHHKSAERLAEIENKYSKLIQATLEGIVIHENGKILEINDSLLRMSGYTMEELRNIDDIRSLVLEKYHGVIIKNMQQGYEGSYKIEGIKKDGTIIPIKISARNMTYMGRNIRMLTVTDLTEQKKIETDLRNERDLFSKIAETSPTGMLQFNIKGKVIFANKMIKEILDLKEDEVLDWTYNDRRWDIKGIDGSIIQEDDLPFARVMKTGKGVQNFLMSIKLPDGKRIYISINNSPIFDENRQLTGVIATIEDITERILTERKLRDLNRQLMEQAENLSKSNTDLEHFAYLASHDLREPLRMISGFAKLLENKYKSKLDSTANDYINYITNGVERMDRLICDLLSLAKISSRKQELKPVDCNVILKQITVSMHSLLEEKNADISYENLPVITADPVQISQLFQNLISNSIKFCDNKPEIRISAKNNGLYWEFSVQDNGIGIDPKHIDRIFHIFQRLHTRDEYTGTGIGLAICKKIIERHGGEIRVKSEPGRGSNFIFKIPVIADTKNRDSN
jgi:PAS domain S-box-containing protein